MIQLADDLASLLLHGLDSPLPEFERNRCRVALALAMRPAAGLRLAYQGRGCWQTTGGAWEPAAVPGAVALHLAVNNAGQWVGLVPGGRRRWAMTIDRARRSLARVDPHLAEVLRAAPAADAPGLRLRDRAGQVDVRWRPAPNAPPVRVWAVPLP